METQNQTQIISSMNNENRQIEAQELISYIIREREREIDNIRRDSEILNEIMTDLRNIVTEQGESLLDIATYTETAKEKTKNALKELKKTHNYKEETCCNFCFTC